MRTKGWETKHTDVLECVNCNGAAVGYHWEIKYVIDEVPQLNQGIRK